MVIINAVQRPPLPQIVMYDEEIIIDSGASDHMCNNIQKLHHIYPAINDVQLPDGSIFTSKYAGLMQVFCTCLDTHTSFIIPLCSTILVPGFTTCLWSVTSFNDSGTKVIFGTSTIRIIMNKSTPSEFKIRLLRPFHKLKQQRIFANMVVVQAPAPRPKTIVHLELLHNRLGHPSMKSLIAAQAAELYNDVSIEFEPTGHCIGCKIGAIRTANRGNHPVGPTANPGSIWFLDIIDILDLYGSLILLTIHHAPVSQQHLISHTT
jgi:hypothetical protein